MLRKLSFFFVSIFITSCSGESVIENKAHTLADEFHQKIISLDFPSIYESASSVFQAHIGEDEFTSMLASINGELGFPVEYSLIKTLSAEHEMGFPIFPFRIITKYEHGNAVETFSFKDESSSNRLVYYYIDSAELKSITDKPGGEE